jgi:extradiol dioxygenase family protein
LQPFHLAIPVDDLAAADAFYAGVLACPRGRRSQAWIDYNFFGHQLVVHRVEGAGDAGANPVDGHDVPVPHFGVVLTPADWKALARRLEQAGVFFALKPDLRFKGEIGEQGTFFVRDPAGNALEFKCFADMSRLFAAD